MKCLDGVGETKIPRIPLEGDFLIAPHNGMLIVHDSWFTFLFFSSIILGQWRFFFLERQRLFETSRFFNEP